MMLANEMCEYIEALTSIVEETDEFEKKERINISSLPNSTPSDKDSKNLIEFYVQQVKQARRAGLEKIDNVLKTSGIKKSIEENNKKIQEEINTLKNPPENYVKAHGGLLLFHTKYTDFTNFVLNPLDETDLSSYHFKFLMNKEMIGIAYIFFLDSILDAYEDELPRTEETRRARDFAQKLKSHAENNDTSHSSDIK